MLEVVVCEYVDFDILMCQLLVIVEQKQVCKVEDFFVDIFVGLQQMLVYWIIFVWYIGCFLFKCNVIVFIYEEVLIYQIMLDVVVIFFYGISGFNCWCQVMVLLVDMLCF